MYPETVLQGVFKIVGKNLGAGTTSPIIKNVNKIFSSKRNIVHIYKI